MNTVYSAYKANRDYFWLPENERILPSLFHSIFKDSYYTGL